MQWSEGLICEESSTGCWDNKGTRKHADRYMREDIRIGVGRERCSGGDDKGDNLEDEMP